MDASFLLLKQDPPLLRFGARPGFGLTASAWLWPYSPALVLGALPCLALALPWLGFGLTAWPGFGHLTCTMLTVLRRPATSVGRGGGGASPVAAVPVLLLCFQLEAVLAALRAVLDRGRPSDRALEFDICD